MCANASNFAALNAAVPKSAQGIIAGAASDPSNRDEVVKLFDALADEVGAISADLVGFDTHLRFLKGNLSRSDAALDAALAAAIVQIGGKAKAAQDEIDRLNKAVGEDIASIVKGANEAGDAVSDLLVGFVNQFAKAAADTPKLPKTDDKPKVDDKPKADATGDKPKTDAAGDKPKTDDKPKVDDKPKADAAGDKPKADDKPAAGDKPKADAAGDKPKADDKSKADAAGDKPKTDDKPAAGATAGTTPKTEPAAATTPKTEPAAATPKPKVEPAAATTPKPATVTSPATPKKDDTPSTDFAVKSIKASSAGIAKYSTAARQLELHNADLATAYQNLATISPMVAVAKACQAQKNLFNGALAQTSDALAALKTQWGERRDNLIAVSAAASVLDEEREATALGRLTEGGAKLWSGVDDEINAIKRALTGAGGLPGV